MQKSDIEWTEFVSNPIKGKCLHACPYCYAERIRQRFKQPEKMSWHSEELAAIERRKKPATIFMGSMYDLFGAWVPREWIMWILDTAKNCPQHTFIFLTKNPARYSEFEFPGNCWKGTTVTNQSDANERITPLIDFVSVEPLLGPVCIDQPVKGVIIGAQSGPGAIIPKRAWVTGIILLNHFPIFIKNNFLKLAPDLSHLREVPWRINK